MQIVRLANETDFEGWRTAARSLIAQGIAPEQVEWRVGGESAGLFDAPDFVPTHAQTKGPQLSVSRDFLSLCKTAILFRDPSRFGQLYRLLWRMQKERQLLQIAFDTDVIKVTAMAQAVRRDLHKMKAFVRFREIASEPNNEQAAESIFVAWFEPSHYIVQASSPFFTGRFANMRWSILTPDMCAHWNGETLRYSPGANKADAPAEDSGEELWRSYYRSIFNPARLKVSAMQSQMPKKYWRNLPEAELIADLVANADKRKDEMIAAQPTEPKRKIVKYKVVKHMANKENALPQRDATHATTATNALHELNDGMLASTEFPIAVHATQAVLGTGIAPAMIMLLGEQPSEQEDLAGEPFIGSVGKLLDQALQEAGIARVDIYATNVVKHYKFKLQGTRRVHLPLNESDINAYLPWLQAEIALVQPQIIIAFGTIAAHAITGKALRVEDNRGKIFPLSHGVRALITDHPAFILRISDQATRLQQYKKLVTDLKLAANMVTLAES